VEALFVEARRFDHHPMKREWLQSSKVVHLERRLDRVVPLHARMERVGIQYELFPGVDGSVYPFTDEQIAIMRSKVKRGHSSVALAKGLMGANLARANLMMSLTQFPAMTFEDDIVFVPDFWERYDAIQLPEDWEIVLLGASAAEGNYWGILPEVYRVTKPWHIHAMLIRNREVAAALAAIWVNFWEGAIDNVWWDFTKTRPTYQIRPPLVLQDASPSDLENVKGFSKWMWNQTHWKPADCL